MDMRQLSIQTEDKHSLSLYEFTPEGESLGTVVIATAMGTTQSFYHPFARWLQDKGWRVIAFDYRGMGESKKQPLGEYRNNILDWAMFDCSAALAHALEGNQGKPTYWIGHSLGGQVFPLVKQIDRVTKVITIAAGTGYWRHNSPALKRKVWFLWFFMVPVLLRLYDHFPGKKFGMVGDLPLPVMRQWRRWCLNPKYCVGVEGQPVKQHFDSIDLPITCLALTDDEMLSKLNIKGLFDLFGSSRKQMIQVNPKDHGLKRVGHLGFFREEFAPTLWQNVLLPELTAE